MRRGDRSTYESVQRALSWARAYLEEAKRTGGDGSAVFYWASRVRLLEHQAERLKKGEGP